MKLCTKCRVRPMPSRRSKVCLECDTRPTCQRCGQKAANRPLRLCWGCYSRHKGEYVSTSKYARKSPVVDHHWSRPASAPTDASPGTEEKLAVLEARALAGEELWHPGDRPGDAGHVGRTLTSEIGPRGHRAFAGWQVVAATEARLRRRGAWVPETVGLA